MTNMNGIQKMAVNNNGINNVSFNREKVNIEEIDFDSINSNSINKSHEKSASTIQKVGATVVSAITSIVEGIGELTEAIIDTGAISKQVMDTPVNAIVDATIIGAKSITDSVNNNRNLIDSIEKNAKDYDSLTKKTWDNTKAFVSNEHIKTAFDNFYESSGSGVKENAYGFDTIRSVGSGVGYVGGIVAISAVTFGVGGAALGSSAAASASATTITASETAAIAGIAGFGKGTQDSWKEGTSTLRGLAAGTVKGGWEALQYGIGAEVETSISSAAGRIVSNAALGASEGLVQPGINMISAGDKTYKEAFDENGGIKSILTGAAIGGSAQAIGEGIKINNIYKKEIPEYKKIKNTNYDLDLQFFGQDIDEVEKIARQMDTPFIEDEEDVAKYFGEWGKNICDNLEQDTKLAVNDYSGTGFGYINKKLRENSEYSNSSINKITDAIQSSKLERDTIAFRGVDLESFKKTVDLEDLDNLENLKGLRYHDNAYTSSTVLNFADNPYPIPDKWKNSDVEITFKIKKGTPALYIESLSQSPNEFELLLDKGINGTIYDVYEENGKYFIDILVD